MTMHVEILMLLHVYYLDNNVKDSSFKINLRQKWQFGGN